MSSQVQASNIQLYGPTATALILAFVALIIAVVGEINSQSLKALTPDNSITSINTVNGFGGTITNHIGSLTTTVNGLISGQKGGKLGKATNAEIIAATMQNYQGGTLSNKAQNITALDSVLQAIERGCVLEQTKLGTTFQARSNPITSDDTLLIFFEKAQGLLNLRQNLFSAFGRTLVGPTIQLWDTPPVYGTPTLPIGFWKLGTAISINSTFNWTANNAPGTTSYFFTFNNEAVTLTFAQTVPSSRNISLSIVMVVQSTTSINVYMTAISSGSITTTETAVSTTQRITYDPKSLTLLGLKATVAGSANNLRFHNSAATILYQS